MTDDEERLSARLREPDGSLDDPAFTRQALRRAGLPPRPPGRRRRLVRTAALVAVAAVALLATPAGRLLADLLAGLGPLGPALVAAAALTWAASASGGH